MAEIQIQLTNRMKNTSIMRAGEPELHVERRFDPEVLSKLKKAAVASDGVVLEQQQSSFSSSDFQRLEPLYQWPTHWSEIYEVLTFTFVNIAAVTAFLRNAVGLGLDVPKLLGSSFTLKLNGEDIQVKEGEDIEEVIAKYRGKDKKFPEPGKAYSKLKPQAKAKKVTTKRKPKK